MSRPGNSLSEVSRKRNPNPQRSLLTQGRIISRLEATIFRPSPHKQTNKQRLEVQNNTSWPNIYYPTTVRAAVPSVLRRYSSGLYLPVSVQLTSISFVLRGEAYPLLEYAGETMRNGWQDRWSGPYESKATLGLSLTQDIVKEGKGRNLTQQCFSRIPFSCVGEAKHRY